MHERMEFDLTFEGIEIQEADPRLIRNVLLCGQRSRNGHDYPASAFSAGLYLNKPVYLDHADASRAKLPTRSVRDLAGIVVSERFDDQGRPRGDILANDTEAGKVLLALAQSKPPNVGMSHVALCERTKDKSTVTRVVEVDSVDLVMRPATTNTFTETTNTHEEPVLDEQAIKELREARDNALTSVGTLQAEVTEFKGKLSALEVEHNKLKDSNKTLEVQVEQYRTAEALAARSASIVQEAQQAGLDVTNELAFSKTFQGQLMAESDAAKRKEMLEERATLLKQAPTLSIPRKTGPTAFDPSKALSGLITE